MSSRNENRVMLLNKHPLYKGMRERRGVNHIRQFASPFLAKPKVSDIMDLDIQNHVWTLGDKYYKLAFEFYGDATYWWVIAWFNQRPTESHLNLGDIVAIPTPLEDVLLMYNDRY